MARFLNSYPGYTAETALAMPWRRFLVLVRATEAVHAENSLRRLEVAVVAAHPGEKGEAYKELVKKLRKALGIRIASKNETVIPGVTPLVQFEAEPGSIAAEHARRKAAWEALQAERGAK